MHRPFLTLLLLSSPLLAGCLAESGVPPHETGAEGVEPPPALPPSPPAAEGFLLHRHESATYALRSDAGVNVTLEVSVEHDGTQLVATWTLDDDVQHAASSRHDVATGRTRSIEVGGAYSIPVGWVQWFPHAVPTNLTASTLVGLGARWLADGADGPDWSVERRFPCLQDCAVGNGRVINSTHVRVAGDEGILPSTVRVQAEGVGAVAWERLEHRLSDVASPSNSGSNASPDLPAQAPCGPVPCGPGPIASDLHLGHSTLVSHPVWQQWADDKTDPFLLTAQLATVVPGGNTTSLSTVWTFLAASEGSDVARFALERPVLGDGLPVLTRYDPLFLPWDPLHSGSTDRTHWPDVDDLFTRWGWIHEPQPGSPLTFAIHNEGAVDNPASQYQHRITYSYGIGDGLAFTYGTADGRLMTVLRT